MKKLFPKIKPPSWSHAPRSGAAVLHRSTIAPSLLGTHRCYSATSASNCDVVIIGGGVVGSSLAMHLADMRGGGAGIKVIEPDATYERASAPRSAGGIRVQFSLPINVELSLYGLQFLKDTLPSMCEGLDVDTDVQLREIGYLMLAEPGPGETIMKENLAVQQAAGAAEHIKTLQTNELAERFPWLSTDGISMGTFGVKGEGYFDPWALLQCLRKGAIARGVEYVPTRLEGFEMSPQGSRINAALLSDESRIVAQHFVNCAGAHGGEVVAMCGASVPPLPVVPRRRCMWLFSVPEPPQTSRIVRPPNNTPFTFDPTGMGFRSEGSAPGHFLCAMGPPPDRDPDWSADKIDEVDEDYFEEVVWPALANRVPAFESLRVESSWAGLYEYNTFDQNGVVGWHPQVPNLLLACGFSGHGLQHSPGVGRACAELLLFGKYQTIDLSCLGYERIASGKPFQEKCIF